MTLAQLVDDHKDRDGDLTVYAKMIDGRFAPASEVVLLSLTNKEHEMEVDDVAAKHCPGFDYFMELFMIQEMAEEMAGDPEYDTPEKRVARVLFFQEHDE